MYRELEIIMGYRELQFCNINLLTHALITTCHPKVWKTLIFTFHSWNKLLAVYRPRHHTVYKHHCDWHPHHPVQIYLHHVYLSLSMWKQEISGLQLLYGVKNAAMCSVVTKWCSVTSQKTWIFSSTTVVTSNMASIWTYQLKTPEPQECTVLLVVLTL
jgi:hypothetical protein